MYAIALVVTVLVERRRIMCIPQSLLCIGRVDVVVGAIGAALSFAETHSQHKQGITTITTSQNHKIKLTTLYLVYTYYTPV